MKAFLDYVSKITIRKPVVLKLDSYSIEIYIGDTYIDDVWNYKNYFIHRRGPIEYKLIGGNLSFFNRDIIYTKLIRYRFI